MIKINLELPEFEKELSISVTLRKDGEVISASSSSPTVKTEVSTSKKKKKEETEITNPTKSTPEGGNLMDLSF